MASKPDLAIVSRLAACLIAWAAASCTTACSKKEPAPAPAHDDTPQTVFAVNYPLTYFAERVAPESVEIVLPAPANVDPAFWKPTWEDIGRYQAAGLILLNGAGYAKWTRTATLPTSRVVVTADGCIDAFLPSGQSGTHRHGPEGEHAHEETAFTTWLDLRLARCQAEHIEQALARLVPTARSSIEERFATLGGELEDLDARLRRSGEAWAGRPMIASHPVYQYLGNAYGLNIESLHFEPDEALDPDAIQALDAVLSRHPATLMLWEANPRSETTRLLADRGIEVVVFEPAANRPSTGDFLTVMRANAQRLGCATGADACPR